MYVCDCYRFSNLMKKFPNRLLKLKSVGTKMTAFLYLALEKMMSKVFVILNKYQQMRMKN